MLTKWKREHNDSIISKAQEEEHFVKQLAATRGIGAPDWHQMRHGFFNEALLHPNVGESNKSGR